MNLEEIKDYIGADSLSYLPINDLKKAINSKDTDFCVGCYTGNYPSPAQKNTNKNKFEEKIGVC